MLRQLHRKPVIGLLGLGVGFLTQPLGHAAYTLIADGFGACRYAAAFACGVLGLAVIGRGLKRDELSATLHGLVGGWLLWVGWFEFSFKFFSVLYDVKPYAVEVNGYAATPHANMLQATVSIMAALFIVYGMFNQQTKCNLMRWLHRALHMSPGMPTPDNQRSFARITAMEMLFVTWFCYLFWLYMIYFGTRPPGATIIQTVYFAWTAWAAYLVYRCTKQVRAAPALRYGLGAGIVLWGSAEMPAHFGAYREYWLHPAEYPAFNAIVLAMTLAGLYVIGRRSGMGTRVPAVDQPAG